MTLRLVEYLAGQHKYDLTFIASRLNAELCRRLGELGPRVTLLLTPYTSRRGQWLRSYFSIKALLQLMRLIQRRQPDLLFVVQGGIALSSLAVLAGRLAGVRTMSTCR